MNMMMDMLSEEPTNHTNEIQNFESLAYFFVNKRNIAQLSRNFQNLKLRSTKQTFIFQSILCVINFGKMLISKITISTVSETLNFESWKVWLLRNGSNLLKSKFRTSKSAKNDIF